MTTALAARSHFAHRPSHKATRTSVLDTTASISVQALIGWMMCQVGIILLFPLLPAAALGFVRMFILATYWLTFSHIFHLRPLHDAALGLSVFGFEWLVDRTCGLPLCHCWVAIGTVWLVAQFDNATKRRVQSFLLCRCYGLLCATVYATTTTERLQSPYLGKVHRALARLSEGLRRGCAHRICTLNQSAAR